MIMKTFRSMAALAVISLLFFSLVSPLTAGETRQEISDDVGASLIEARKYYAKDMRFCWNEAGGQFCNDISMNDAGSIYVTETGIIHRGEKYFLVRWQDIKKIAKPMGQPDALRIWTVEPTEKLMVMDYMRTGSSNTLDTGINNLLNAMKKYHKKFKGLPIKPLPKPALAPAPPAASPQPATPPPPKATPAPVPATAPKTLDIKSGMTPNEVEKQLGPPLKRITLEKKTIYQYKDMVLTFIDGKLKDVSMK